MSVLGNDASAIRSVFLRQDRRISRAHDPVDWLAAVYEESSAAERASLRAAVRTVLENAFDTDDPDRSELILHGLDAVRRLGIVEAVPAISAAVEARKLTDSDDCAEHHGTALEMLVELQHTSPLLLWQRERHLRDFAPLVFSLVLANDSDQAPSLLPEVASLGFLREALDAMMATHPDDADRLLQNSARTIANQKDADLSALFEGDVRTLDLPASQLLRVLTALRGAPSLMVIVILPSQPVVAEAVNRNLRALGIHGRLFDRADAHAISLAQSADILLLTDHPTATTPALRNKSHCIIVYTFGEQRPSPLGEPRRTSISVSADPEIACSQLVEYVCARLVAQTPAPALLPGRLLMAKTMIRHHVSHRRATTSFQATLIEK